MISCRYLIWRHQSPCCRVFSSCQKTSDQFDLFLAHLQTALAAEPLFTLERAIGTSQLELSFSSDFLESKEDKFSIDFTSKRYTSRISRSKQELLVKAIGMKSESNDYIVWDLTAGVGRDAFVMAAAGCRVHMFEKNPVLYSLLFDGLQRLASSSDHSAIASRLQLHHLDSTNALNQTTLDLVPRDIPSAIYLDPMYSSLDSIYRKSKPKKETQILQRLTHLEHLGRCCSTTEVDTITTTADQQSNDLLLRAALQRASMKGGRDQRSRCRVVVKRAKSAQSLLHSCPEVCPDVVFRGSTQRFDTYFPS